MRNSSLGYKRRHNATLMGLKRQRFVATNDDMPTEKKMHPISIRLDPDVRAALDELAREDSRSLSQYVNLALRRHVEQAQRDRARKEK